MTPFWIAVSVALSFAAGLLAGIILHKTVSPGSTKRRRLEGRMDQLRDEYVRYQADVTQHFDEAGQLIKRLNKDYESVITHLAQGASKLADGAEFNGGELLSRIRSGKISSAANANSDQAEQLHGHLRLPPDVAIEGYHGPDGAAAQYAVDDLTTETRSEPRHLSADDKLTTSIKSDLLQVPSSIDSTIAGVKVARRHVETANYEQQQVDGYVEAPRDYAPRRGPDDNGTLTEGYNLSRDGLEHDLRR